MRLDRKQEDRVTEYERGNIPEAERIFTPASDDLWERGWARLNRREDTYGDALPWHKTQTRFRLRPSEMTLWAGPNGSMKSLTVNYILAHLAWHGQKVFVASLELTADDQLARIARQFLCEENPSRARYDSLRAHFEENLMVYDFVGQMRPERVLALARYAASDLGAAHVLIDNLTMAVPPSESSDEKAATLVAGLRRVARDTGCHLHMICHVRKPSDDKILGRYDIRGTGAAPDQVDNVVMIQRNDAKRRALDAGSEAKRDEPDIFITVDKQNQGAYMGTSGFWFFEKQLRLMDSPGIPPQEYA